MPSKDGGGNRGSLAGRRCKKSPGLAGLRHVLADVGKHLLLGIGQRHSGGDEIEQAGGRVHVDHNGIHALEDGEILGSDDDVDALVEFGEVRVGDDDGDLDELVLAQVQSRHLAVDPDESIGRGHGRRLPSR